MPEKIIIPQPCNEKWNEMTPCTQGRHCQVCKTAVIDFTKMDLEQIQGYFENKSGQKICGLYHDRHIRGKENEWYGFLNRLETKFSQRHARKFAILLIHLLLLFSACKTKKTKGRRILGGTFLVENSRDNAPVKRY